MGKEGASNLVSLLSKSLEPVVDMHNNDRVICSCEKNHEKRKTGISIMGVIARNRKVSGTCPAEVNHDQLHL